MRRLMHSSPIHISSNQSFKVKQASAITTMVGGLISIIWFKMTFYKKVKPISKLTKMLSRQNYLSRIIFESDIASVAMVRMRRDVFTKLCSLLKSKGLLCDTIHVTVEEQMAIFLHTLSHNVKNRVIGINFLRSGETVSRYFKHVLHAIGELRVDLIYPPRDTPREQISTNPTYMPYFKAHPKHEPYLNKPIELYEEMSLISGNDFAIGVWSKSLSQTSKSLGTKLDGSSSNFTPISLEGPMNTQTEASPLDSNTNNDTDNDVEFLGNSQAEVEELVSGSSNKEKESKHKRRKRMDYGIEVMNKVANNIGNLAAALTMDINRNFTKELYDEIMALDGYTNGVKSVAYDFLLRMGNESLARGFLSRNIEMKKNMDG